MSLLSKYLAFSLLALGLPLSARSDWKSAAAWSSSHGEKSLLIWENGRTVLDRYSPGASEDRPQNIYSITKSLCALGSLAAIGRGNPRLEEKACDVLTEWQGDSRKREITVRHLLQQTSGIHPGYETLYTKNLVNKENATLRLNQISTPGTSFAYGPSHYEALEIVIHRSLGRDSSATMEKALLNQLGIYPRSWRRDKAGLPYFSAGLSLTSHNLLAVGQLIRRQGWWFIFPLIPTPLMEAAATGSAANAAYGMGCWLNRNADKTGAQERDVELAISAHLSSAEWKSMCLARQAPADLIALVGSYGQRVYISRSRKLVIVRFGEGSSFRDPEFLNTYFASGGPR